MSCLDLIIASSNLEPFIKCIDIDSQMNFSPVRPLSKTKSVTSDHFPIIVEFVEKFSSKVVRKASENNVVWNTNKEGGWQSYKELTENDFVLPETECNTVAMKKIEKEIERIKYNAFGKVKVKCKSLNKNITKVGNEELLKTQRKEVEFQFKRINDIRSNKDNTAAVFDVLRIVNCPLSQPALCGVKASLTITA